MIRTIVSLIALVGGFGSAAFGLNEPPIPPPCTEGTFIVDGAPLLPAPTATGEDAVVLHDGQVSIASGCPAVAAEIRATPFGTLIRARWQSCGDIAQGVRLFAYVRPSCQRMLGYLTAAQPSIRRRFVAAQCNDPASCRDFCKSNDDCEAGEYCAKRVGRCDLRGVCRARPTACTDEVEPVCGCDGNTYSNLCDGAAAGVSVAHRGRCEVACDPAAPVCGKGEFCERPPGTCDRPDVRGLCIDTPEVCPDIYIPVCGCDGMTYSNDCDRRAAGVSRAHDGPCAECTTSCDCYPRPFERPCAALCPTCDNFWTCREGQCVAMCGPRPPNACQDLCATNDQCADGELCLKYPGSCDGRGVCRERPDVCPDVSEPVCGCDGKSYANRCAALAAGTSIAHAGRCRQVCGTIAGIPCPAGEYCELPPGMCRSADLGGVCTDVPEVCPLVIEPVCGCDGVTYGNDCERLKAGVQRAHRGACANASTIR